MRIKAYAREIESVSEEMQPVSVITTTASSEYARLIRDTVEMRRTRADELPKPACDELDAIGELLRSLSISRQYYKTIALQQDFAQLSRLLIYMSLPAALVAIYAPLLYQSGPDTLIATQYLPAVLSAAITVVLIPLILLLVHLLRITTIMRYTVSVGPFAPPFEWPWTE